MSFRFTSPLARPIVTCYTLCMAKRQTPLHPQPLHITLNALRIATLRASTEHLHKELDALRDAYAALRAKRDALAAERDAERAAFRDECARLMSVHLAARERDEVRIADLQAERDAIAAERDALRGERDALRGECHRWSLAGAPWGIGAPCECPGAMGCACEADRAEHALGSRRPPPASRIVAELRRLVWPAVSEGAWGDYATRVLQRTAEILKGEEADDAPA